MRVDFSDALSDEEEVAQYDPVSKQPVVWGNRVVYRMTEQDFDHLRIQHEVISRQEMDTVYFVVTKRIDWAMLIAKHGPPVQVGVGPRGGFKWVRMTDDTYWGHAQFREGAQKWAKKHPRFKVKCSKDGKSLQPARRTLGSSRR